MEKNDIEDIEEGGPGSGKKKDGEPKTVFTPPPPRSPRGMSPGPRPVLGRRPLPKWKAPEEEKLSVRDYLGQKKEFIQMAGSVFSEGRTYVKDPSQVPPGVSVKQGSHGGYYYDTDGGVAAPKEPAQQAPSGEPSAGGESPLDTFDDEERKKVLQTMRGYAIHPDEEFMNIFKMITGKELKPEDVENVRKELPAELEPAIDIPQPPPTPWGSGKPGMKPVLGRKPPKPSDIGM